MSTAAADEQISAARLLFVHWVIIEKISSLLSQLRVWHDGSPSSELHALTLAGARYISNKDSFKMLASFLTASNVAASALIWIWRFCNPSEFGAILSIEERGITCLLDRFMPCLLCPLIVSL